MNVKNVSAIEIFNLIMISNHIAIIHNNNILIHISLAIIVCLCFGNSLHGDFVFDDTEALVQNADIQNSIPLLQIFQHDFWGNNITDKASHKSYRPLTVLLYRFILNLQILFEKSNQPRPVYYHAANLIFYYLVCVQLYKALCSFLVSPIINYSKHKSIQIACWTTLLFASHPIHCEAVINYF